MEPLIVSIDRNDEVLGIDSHVIVFAERQNLQAQ